MKSIQLFSIIAAGMLSAGTLWAQNPDPGNCCPMMGAHKKEMMEWHQKMVDKFKAQNVELEKLVAEMNAATGEKKVDAIATVVNQMAKDRKEWVADAEEGHRKFSEWMKEMKEKMEKKMEKKESKD